MHLKYWALGIAPLALVASHASAQVADTQPLDLDPDTPKAQIGVKPGQAPAQIAIHSEETPAPSVMSLEDLDDMRGGTQTAINSQTVISQIIDNTIEGNFTAGDVSFSDNALSGFNGLGNIVVNTGALSSLQATLGVTINTAE